MDLWTTRSTEFPTSPTGLHYDGFSQSNSTRNDEEPYEDAPFAQELELKGVGKPANQDAAETAARGWECLRVARELFFGGSQHAQEIATQTVRLLFVPGKGFGNFCLRRRFKRNLPDHSLTPSDCAI